MKPEEVAELLAQFVAASHNADYAATAGQERKLASALKVKKKAVESLWKGLFGRLPTEEEHEIATTNAAGYMG